MKEEERSWTRASMRGKQQQPSIGKRRIDPRLLPRVSRPAFQVNHSQD